MDSYRFLLSACLLLIGTASMGLGQLKNTYFAVGEVIGFLPTERCFPCEPKNRSVGVQVEHWVVRVKEWKEPEFGEIRYIVVQYQNYQGGLSDSDLKKLLAFELQKPLHRADSCFARIDAVVGKDTGFRKARLSDFKLVGVDRPGEIKDFNQVPCFEVRRLPKPTD